MEGKRDSVSFIEFSLSKVSRVSRERDPILVYWIVTLKGV